MLATCGGDLTVQGVAIHQAASSSIRTNGGAVDFRSGSLDANGFSNAILFMSYPYSVLRQVLELKVQDSPPGS